MKVFRKNYSTTELNEILQWRDCLKYLDFSITWEDGDFFFLIFLYKNKEELFFILKKSGIILNIFPENYEKIIPGKTYGEGEKMPTAEILDLPDFMQPEYIKINDISAHCWIGNGVIKLTLVSKNDFNWSLTKTGYENSLKIEQFIEVKGLAQYVKLERICKDYTL